MYREPYNNLINMKYKESIQRINKEINEEKNKGKTDEHRINRLNEMKILQGMFNTEIGSAYGKYRSPW